MNLGRFCFVAFPLILTIAAIISFLVATLSGIAHNNLYIFSVDLNNLTLNSDTLGALADQVDINLPGNVEDINIGKRAGDSISASDLGLGRKYDINLWGYCYQNDGDKRKCTDAKFNWAEDVLDPKKIEETGNMGKLGLKLPDEIKDALNTFRVVIKWAEVAFIIALIALGVEFVVGIFSNFSRGISCLTWLLASITAALVCAAAALATATSAVVVGTVEGSTKLYGLKGDIDTKFLAAVWIGAAFAIGAAFFWIFTICCCKPEHRSSRRNKHHSSDGEKLLGGGGFASRGYAPLSHEHEMTAPAYHSPSLPQFHEPAEHHAAPRYPSGTATRSDLAYEPYSHRA